MANLTVRLQRFANTYRPLLQKSLFKATTWYMGGIILEKAIYVVGIFCFTRLLTPEQYGTVSLFTTWASIFMIALSFNLFPALRRLYHEHDSATYNDYVSSALLFGLATILLASLILSFLPSTLFSVVFSLEKHYILLVCLATFLDYPLRVLQAVWWESYRYKSNVIYTVSLALLNVCLSVVFILFLPALLTEHISEEYGRIGGIIAAHVLLLLVFIWPNRHLLGRLAINWTYVRAMLIFSVPMIPHAVATIILAQFDRIMIDAMVGRFETGLYSYGYQIGLIFYMVMYATNRAWSPWFMEKMNQKHYALLSYRNRQYLHLMVFFTGLAVLISPFIVKLIAPSEYQSATAITPIIVVSTYFLYLYTQLSTFLMYEKKTVYISLGTVSAGVLNIALNYLFIPLYGYTAAAWTTLASYACLFVMYWVLSRRYFPREADLFQPFWMTIYGIILIVLAIVVAGL